MDELKVRLGLLLGVPTPPRARREAREVAPEPLRHGAIILTILRAALTGNEPLLRSYAALLAEKMDTGGYSGRIAESIRSYLAGDFRTTTVHLAAGDSTRMQCTSCLRFTTATEANQRVVNTGKCACGGTLAEYGNTEGT